MADVGFECVGYFSDIFKASSYRNCVQRDCPDFFQQSPVRDFSYELCPQVVNAWVRLLGDYLSAIRFGLGNARMDFDIWLNYDAMLICGRSRGTANPRVNILSFQ